MSSAPVIRLGSGGLAGRCDEWRVTSDESKKTKRLKDQETKRRRHAMSALFIFWKRAGLRKLIKKECGKRKRDKVRGLDRRTGRD